jgi:hypothetical protein
LQEKGGDSIGKSLKFNRRNRGSHSFVLNCVNDRCQFHVGALGTLKEGVASFAIVNDDKLQAEHFEVDEAGMRKGCYSSNTSSKVNIFLQCL